jgi:radical SAM superfamily enzyme YgiQ (UPF0313 family)
MNRFERVKWLSLFSLRIESGEDLAEEVKRVRKTGLLLLRSGNERLRGGLIKRWMKRSLPGTVRSFSKGWRNIKLYFMMGLPTEKDEDLRGILDLSKKIHFHGERQRVHPTVNVSVSTFVPKPHTPFQWESQISLPEIKDRLSFLREEAKRNRLHLKWQDPHLSYLEGVFFQGGTISPGCS